MISVSGTRNHERKEKVKMSNNAAKGYVVMVLKQLEYKNEEIDKILSELNIAFDMTTEANAEEYYNNSAWK